MPDCGYGLETRHMRNGAESPTIDPDFARSVAFHRGWLKRHNLLGRPWFVLCSAPQPSIPRTLPDNTVYAYVKFAGRSASKLGLPVADITLATWWKAEREKDIKLNAVLRVRPKLDLAGRLKRLVGPSVGKQSDVLGQERDDYVLQTLGSRFRGVGDHVRPSMGITMIAFALAHDIPEIIVAGMSFERSGHEYNPSGSVRKHVAEDRAALRIIAERYPQVKTTEPSLSEDSGIPLYAP